MKIEKVNENQIRCTLTREDLASRELKISELAYGTEKAKTLFRDMMKQANFEFGFEAEDIPLMIEAIPLNTECIVLIITKVEDPEELDTRFSRFAPSVTEDSDGDDADFQYADNASNEILDLFRQMQTQQETPGSDTSASDSEPADAGEHRRIFRMNTLRQIMDVSSVIAGSYHGSSTLYRESHTDGSTKGYLLLLAQGEEDPASFDRFCNIISEYGTPQRPVSGDDAFLAEHYEALISGNALHALAGSVS
ncbi:MAG TPA: competence protein [Lachnospiraceae bacterium]|nr:competence protein [Lachnospiraceae bacterium]